MIKTSRQIDTIIFNLPSDISFGDISVQSGWNQIKRQNGIYNVYRLENLQEPYVFLHMDEMPLLLTTIFEKQIKSEGDFEAVEHIPEHTHKKPSLKRVG